MSRRRLLPAIAALVLCTALGANVLAHAASLSLTQARLTTATVPATVPVSTCSLTSSADTYASSAVLSTGTNYGAETTIHVRSDLLGNKRAFVAFDLASCTIPATARVLTSTLGIRLTTAPTTSRTVDLHRVTASWTQASLTWSNQPATAGSATASVSTGTTSGVDLTANLLAEVAAFVAGSATNNGWRLKDRTESALTAAEARFSSREGSTPPTLLVTYYP